MENLTSKKKTLVFSTAMFLFSLLAFALILKAPLLDRVPTDWDEGVHLYLSQKMKWTFGDYSTQGSIFAEKLHRNLYRAPVFHHPPLVPYLIKILSTMFGHLNAAKILNISFALISILLTYFIAIELSGVRAGILASFFWVVCPLFNIQGILIHLDLPLTVFTQAGLYFYLSYEKNRLKKIRLYVSGIMFSLAMLTKYTAPIFILIPFCLLLSNRENLKETKESVVYLSLASLGFLWWVFILLKFGSLVPEEFVGLNNSDFSSLYIESVSKRNWYHVWFYFFCICPAFVLYLGGVFYGISKVLINIDKHWELNTLTRQLLLINISYIVCTIGFNVANAFTNGYWIMRHNMPLFPIIYITIAIFIVKLLENKNREYIAPLLVLVFISLVSMGISTFLTLTNITQLRPVPWIFFWVPGWQSMFY